MSSQSNIAEDIAVLFERLHSGSGGEAGASHLAAKFQVETWSRDFFEIIAAIMQNLDTLEHVIEQVVTREPARSRAIAHIQTLRTAFDHSALSQQWQNLGAERTNATRTGPLLSLGGSLQAFDYERPDAEEVEEMRADAADLLEWLKSHQLEEQDFIRACLIDGVERFLFRLDKLQWVGWGYATDSLRQVVGAYLAIERGLDPVSMPQTDAVLKKVASKLKKAFDLVSKGREARENAQALVSVYNTAMPLITGVVGYIAASS